MFTKGSTRSHTWQPPEITISKSVPWSTWFAYFFFISGGNAFILQNENYCRVHFYVVHQQKQNNSTNKIFIACVRFWWKKFESHLDGDLFFLNKFQWGEHFNKRSFEAELKQNEWTKEIERVFIKSHTEITESVLCVWRKCRVINFHDLIWLSKWIKSSKVRSKSY